MADTERYSLTDLLDFFRTATEGERSATRVSYQKAVAAFGAYIQSRDSLAGEIVDTRLLEDWLVHMCLRKLTFKTASYYFDIVSGLYSAAVREGIAPATTAFSEVKSRVKALGAAAWTRNMSDDEFQRVIGVTRSAHSQKGDIATATDMMLFSLLNGCLKLAEVAKVKHSDLPAYASGSEEIAGRHIDPRRRYVFDLQQSMRTPRQLDRYINDLELTLFRLRNLPLTGTVDDTLRAYWACAALRCGFSGSEIVSALGCVPAGLPVLAICSRVEPSAERLAAMREAVACQLLTNPLRWYAMRLRPGVRFEDVQKRFRIFSSEIAQPEMFYPCDEIVRRIGKRLVAERRPVIADVVFFRSRITDILPIFRHIGDLAWCYTSGGKSGGSYASITDYEFRVFQQAIGQFTPDFEVGPIGTLSLREGDRIVVVGGMMPGQTGDIARIVTDRSQNVIYRIRFGSPNGMKWDFGVDARIARTAPA